MNDANPCCDAALADPSHRRTFLKAGLGAGALQWLGACAAAGQTESAGVPLSREQRDALTPDRVIAMMKEGNARFRSGQMRPHDYLAQKRASASGQFPAAVILSCIDSRAPAEILLDMGIGDTFNARVAGNIANKDIVGSLEFACAAAGAKVVLVMGHTACGAVAGAIDNVKLGNLTSLLEVIRPSIANTRYTGDRSAANAAFVDAVATTNVRATMDWIRKSSPILANLESKGTIKIAGSMYDLATGTVTFFE